MSTLEPDSKSTLHELMHIVRQVNESIASEQRLDQDFEVLDAVRFEQGLVDWRSRIPNSQQEVRIQLNHLELTQVLGHVTQLSYQVTLCESASHEFLINNDCVVAISGLLDRVKNRKAAATDDFLLKIWLHDICDRQLDATWYLGNNSVIRGYCLRTGSDSVDVLCGKETISIALGHLVAVRVSSLRKP